MSEQENYLMSLILASNHNEAKFRAAAIDELGFLIPGLGSPQLRAAAHEAIAARLGKQVDLEPCQLKESKVLGALSIQYNVRTLARQILQKLNTPEALAILYPSRIQSKLYWPNAWARSYFTAYANPEDRGGHSALVAIFQMFHGMHLGWENFPADNLKREIDFVDIGSFNQALLTLYGRKAGLSRQIKTGEYWFANFLPELAPILKSEETPRTRVLQGLQALAKLFSNQSDQLSHVEEEGLILLFVISQCPHCWGINAASAFCQPMSSFLTGLVRAVNEQAGFTIIETDCRAKGDEACVFRIELLDEAWDS